MRPYQKNRNKTKQQKNNNKQKRKSNKNPSELSHDLKPVNNQTAPNKSSEDIETNCVIKIEYAHIELYSAVFKFLVFPDLQLWAI